MVLPHLLVPSLLVPFVLFQLLNASTIVFVFLLFLLKSCTFLLRNFEIPLGLLIRYFAALRSLASLALFHSLVGLCHVHEERFINLAFDVALVPLTLCFHVLVQVLAFLECFHVFIRLVTVGLDICSHLPHFFSALSELLFSSVLFVELFYLVVCSNFVAYCLSLVSPQLRLHGIYFVTYLAQLALVLPLLLVFFVHLI